MFVRVSLLMTGLLLLGLTGCSHTGPARSIVSKSPPGPGTGPSSRGQILPVDFESIQSKEPVVLEPDDTAEPQTRWGLLNPFASRKKRIPLPITPAETESLPDRSVGGF